jgi:hypothetical protein
MPAITVNGVDAEIALDGGVREAQPADGPRATVVYQCAYDERYQLLQGLLPYGRNVPHAYPPSPNLYALECVGVEGVGPRVDAAGWMIYQKAKVAIEYRIPGFAFGFGASGIGGSGPTIDPGTPGIDPSGQAWTTTTTETSAEILKIPSGGYVLEDGSPIEDSAAGLILPQFTFRIKRHFVLIIPLSWVEARIGAINSHPVKIGNKVFARGTLMLGGMTSETVIDTVGQVVSSVEYTLIGRGRGIQHNQFLARDGTWKLANTAADLSGSYPYPYVELHAGGSSTFLGLP